MITETLLLEAAKQVANLAKVIIGLANDPSISKDLKGDIEVELQGIRDYMKTVEKNEQARLDAIRATLKASQDNS